jgi:hypothetical protein
MSYFLLYGVFAIWVLFDGLNRKMAFSALWWTAGTAIFGPIILPVYLASRPLKQGEVREGGKSWNVLKNFAILWTMVMAVATIAGMMAMAKTTTGLESDAARAGAGIGMVLGLGVLGAAWFFPTMGAALLGFLLKKSSIVEVGPTGMLLGQTSASNAVGGWAGLVGVAVIGLIVVGLGTEADSGTKLPRTSTTANASNNSDAAANPVGTISGWEVSREANQMDGTKQVYVSIDAADKIPGVIGSNRPTLTIQCGKRKTELVINVGSPLQNEYGEYDSYAVRVKFNNGKPTVQRWTGATNNEAVFSPSPVQLVKQLSKADVFYFEFTPFERSATTVKFNVSGLKEKLDTVQDVCGGFKL